MRLVFYDCESYWDRKSGYSLSSMSTEAYIRDPRFELHGAAIKWDRSTSAVWYDERELRYILKEENWDDVFLVSHHAQWDHGVLSMRYNVHPKMSGCTLAMSRLIFGNHLSVSLDSVRKYFNLPPKITPYGSFEGKHWHEMSRAVQEGVAQGACDEVESKVTIFERLLRDHKFPVEEFEVIDSIVKMFSEPVLELDTAMLAKLWEEEATKKANGIEALGVLGEELRSADRFCELLEAEGIEIEYKDGKNAPIPAIAKNDPFMRDFLREHDNPRVCALAEARLAEKSTLLQTRAATLGWVASRGPAPVYLFYSGAGTLRPSGGDGCNWLNFKRGSPIRRAVKAPAGFYLAPVDASQIECRVLHYLAGGADDPVIQKFRANEDPYVDLASHFYQEQIYKPKSDDPRKEEMEAKRGMGKQGRLMCFGYGTKVLTCRGWIAIVDVLKSDLLWDGIEWVKHQGLIYQGEQNVVDLKGVEVTSDHLILCDPQVWLPAFMLLNENILSRALAAGSANLPWLGLNSAQKAVCSTWLSDVRAERLSIPLSRRIFSLGGQLVAQNALARQLVFGLKNITDMLIFALTTNIDFVCSAELELFLRVVHHQIITPTIVMAGAESRCISLGSKIAGNFCRIWLAFPGGMNRLWNWIEKTTMDITRRVIFDLLRAESTAQINGQSINLKKKIPTYDLSFAGPRNRFTILSNMGPLIVHNCGYGASGKQFKATAASGQYGPRVDMTIDEADSFVALYRRENQPVTARNTGYWAQCERLLARLGGGPPMEFGPMHVENGRIYIQGAPMIYDTIEYHTPQPGDDNPKSGWRVKKRDGWRFIWGSKLTQNICEGVSRMIVSQAMIRIKKKYGIQSKNWPYDELLLVIPRNGREEEMLQLCIAEMVLEPSWLPGIPLAAEGALGERYDK